MKPKKILLFILVLILLGIIGVIDFVLPVEVTSYAFYLIPIGTAAWRLGLRSALFICLLSTGLWILANPELIARSPHAFIYGWNLLARLTTFVLFAIVITRLRAALAEKDDLIRRLRRALSEAHQTETHFHPVCRECGHVRLNKDHWVTTEQFLSRKTDRDFATTCCNECLKDKKTTGKAAS